MYTHIYFGHILEFVRMASIIFINIAVSYLAGISILGELKTV